MSNNDWTSKLRERMADFQEPVSDDLWTSISQSLDAQPAKKIQKAQPAREPQKAQTVKMSRWWAAAAASVALLGVGGIYVYLHQAAGSEPMAITSTSGQSTLASHSQALASVQQTLASRISESSHSPVGAPLPAVASEAPALPAVASEAPSAESELVSVGEQPECTAMEHAEAAMRQDPPMGTSTNTRAASNRRNDYIAISSPSAHSESAPLLERMTRGSSPDFTVQLYAENGVLTAENTSGRVPALMDIMDDPANGMGCYSIASMPNLSLLKLTNKPKAKHHAPIAVGAQVGMHVGERLSLNTGVVYTRTSSDFAPSAGADYDKKQVLHYVGIPLTANYEVWGIKQLHTYVMLGGQVDFNVKNDTKKVDVKQENVEKDRPQFSGKASLGLQYDVVKQVGLYLEPGVKYYFDNGSKIDNTFKDKKWNFNLQLGLRANL